jgi:hypothetical protein
MTAREISFVWKKKGGGIVIYFKNYTNVTKFSAEQS